MNYALTGGSNKARNILKIIDPNDMDVFMNVRCTANMRWNDVRILHEGPKSHYAPFIQFRGKVESVFVENGVFPNGMQALQLVPHNANQEIDMDADDYDASKNVAISGSHSRRRDFVVNYMLTDNEQASLFAKGLAHSEFRPPDIFYQVPMEIPIEINLTVCYDDNKNSICIVTPIRTFVETNGALSGYDDITEYFEHYSVYQQQSEFLNMEDTNDFGVEMEDMEDYMYASQPVVEEEPQVEVQEELTEDEMLENYIIENANANVEARLQQRKTLDIGEDAKEIDVKSEKDANVEQNSHTESNESDEFADALGDVEPPMADFEDESDDVTEDETQTESESEGTSNSIEDESFTAEETSDNTFEQLNQIEDKDERLRAKRKAAIMNTLRMNANKEHGDSDYGE